jgi:hypothetical protein
MSAQPPAELNLTLAVLPFLRRRDQRYVAVLDNHFGANYPAVRIDDYKRSPRRGVDQFHSHCPRRGEIGASR